MATTLTRENREYRPHHWEEVDCLFCGSPQFRGHEKYGPDHRYTYVQCEQCALVYARPRPRYDAEFIEAAYSLYDTESHHLVTRGQLSADERALVEQYKITLRQIEAALGRKGQILDIGCATGLFILAAQEDGWNPIGIDISASMTTAAHLNFGLTTYCGQYHELDLSRHGTFDAIYCSHVIEHIPNPNAWGEKFRADLKPDGVLCLNIPNQFSIDRVFKRGLKRLGLRRDHWERWRTPDHLFEPHLDPMRFFLHRHHFEILSAFTYSGNESPNPTWAQNFFHRVLKIGPRLRILSRPLPVLKDR